MGFCQNIPDRFWASFFQNLNFFHFSWPKIWLVCREVMIFLLTQLARLGGLLRDLEHVRKVHRKCFSGLWKKFQSSNLDFVRIFLTDFELHFFKISTFFTFPGIKSKSCLPPNYKIAQNSIQSCPQCDFSWARKSIYWYIEIPYTFFVWCSQIWNIEKVMIESPQTPESLWINHFISQGNEVIL